jgi:hypothetical protein
LCRKKNGTGGHPVRALTRAVSDSPAPKPSAAAEDAGAEPGNDPWDRDEGAASADDHGELRLVLPFQDAVKTNTTIEWTDTRYDLAIDGTHAALIWAGSVVSHRKACQALLDENQKTVTQAQKGDAPTRLSAEEAHHLPKFGVCQPAGLGSWALTLNGLTAKGDGSARSLAFDLAVAFVDLEGRRTTAPFGSIEVAPGGLEVGPLRTYDYDGDGRDELVVPFEVKALPAGATPPAPKVLWTWNGTAILPYANAPTVTGGLGVEQLDSDMRPDLGSYGPFVAWLTPECGAKSCAPRITGPKFYFHSLPAGDFRANDEAASAALQRVCPKQPSAVVVTGSGGLNLARTAENLVCARVHAESAATLRAELDAKHQDLCGERATCPLATIFETWLSAPLPVELPAANKSK